MLLTKQICQPEVILQTNSVTIYTDNNKTLDLELTPIVQQWSRKEFENVWHIANKNEKPRMLRSQPAYLREVFSSHLTAFAVENTPADLQEFLTAVKTPYPEYANYWEFTRANVDIFIFCQNIHNKLFKRTMTGMVGPTYFDEFYFPRQRVIFMNSYDSKLRYSLGLGMLYFYASFVVHETRHKLDQNLSRLGKLPKFFTTYLEPIERRANIEQLQFAAASEKIFPDLRTDQLAQDLLWLDIWPEIKKYNQALHLEKDNIELERP
ncbi:MAG: hypothetical protein LBJ25_08420 [Candidatus Margulisbacteria bacterium]|nr:hypothetical protein [Candidatus Margulisiibacteriota bacterium]